MASTIDSVIKKCKKLAACNHAYSMLSDVTQFINDNWVVMKEEGKRPRSCGHRCFTTLERKILLYFWLLCGSRLSGHSKEIVNECMSEIGYAGYQSNSRRFRQCIENIKQREKKCPENIDAEMRLLISKKRRFESTPVHERVEPDRRSGPMMPMETMGAEIVNEDDALLPSGPGSVVIAKQYPDESISILSTESQSSSVFTEPSTLYDGFAAFGPTESQFNAPVSESPRTLSFIEENPSFPSSPVAHFTGTYEMGNPFYSQGDVEREDREAYLQQQRDLMYSETPFPYKDYQTNKFARNGFVLPDNTPAGQENLNAICFSSYSPIGFPSI